MSRRLASGFRALTGTSAGASIVLAVLVLATVFIAVVTPRATVAFKTRALHQVFARTPVIGRTVDATLDYTVLGNALGVQPGSAAGISAQQLEQVGAELAGNLTSRGVPLQPPPARWSGLTSGYASVPGASGHAYFGTTPPKIEVLYRPGLARYSRLVRGSMPMRAAPAASPPRFQVAVTQQTASRFALRPGSALSFPGQAVFTISGIIKPVMARSSFWLADPDAARPSFSETRAGSGSWLGGIFIGRTELSGVEHALDRSQMTVQWEYPLRLAGLSANQAAPLSRSLGHALITGGLLTSSVTTITSASLDCGLSGGLSEFIVAIGRIDSLLALLEVSLAILGAIVLFLAGLLLAERRSGEFAQMRARGASSGQLAWLALRAGLVAVIPAAAAGALAAVLATPGGDQPSATWLGALTVVAALAGFPVLAVRRASSWQRGGRSDLPPGRAARTRRLVADTALILAAAGGLAVLRQQGAPSGGQTDWLTSAAPVLVAAPVAIVVVRLYPLVTRWLVRLTGRQQGVTAFVGLARAARTSVSAVLPAFALVVVLGIVAFGATLRAAVNRGDVAASWRATGADVVVDAAESGSQIGRRLQRTLTATSGVRRAAAIGQVAGAAGNGTPVAVIVIDPARYAALIAETPQRPFPAGALGGGDQRGPVPILVSPAARALIGHGPLQVGLATVRVRVAGQVAAMPGSGATGAFVVVSGAAIARVAGPAEAAPTRLLLVGSGIDTARLRAELGRLLPAASITVRSRLLAALAGAPLPHGTYVAYAQGAAAAGLFGVVVLLIMLALGARSRELTLARLFTMGLSPAQARRLVLAEALPLLVAAVAGGIVCAWLLVPLVGPSLDLSPLTGSAAPVPVRADYAALGVLAAGLLILALATLFAQSAATRFGGIARGLRAGE